MDVKIYRPSKSTTQSGLARTEKWVLEYELATPRHPESLMGWTASGDTLNQVRLSFETMDEAVAFAERKGWHYTVLPPRDRKIRPRNYSDNFRYRPAAGDD